MPTKENLLALMDKYRTHPQLLGVALGLDPNQRGAMGDTLLHFAVEAGDIHDVETLVQASADINARGDLGNTPLHSAALLGKVAVAKRLIELGASWTMKNEFEETPLDVAINGDRSEIVRLLQGK